VPDLPHHPVPSEPSSTNSQTNFAVASACDWPHSQPFSVSSVLRLVHGNPADSGLPAAPPHGLKIDRRAQLVEQFHRHARTYVVFFLHHQPGAANTSPKQVRRRLEN
jgi:hypothetical protein